MNNFTNISIYNNIGSIPPSNKRNYKLNLEQNIKLNKQTVSMILKTKHRNQEQQFKLKKYYHINF